MSTTYVSTAGNDLILLDDPDATNATKNTRSGTVSKLFAALTLVSIMCASNSSAVPLVGGAGLTPNASALAQYVMNNYPGVQSIGGVRHDPLPDHPSGRAIDIMVGTNTALGNTIYADISSQSARFGVSYILWQSDPAHWDHIHVTVN